MQITQFVIDLGLVYFGSKSLQQVRQVMFDVRLFSAYAHIVSKHYRHILPYPGDCAGEEYAASTGCLILTSYLFLFIQFYINTYKKPVKKSEPVKKSAAVANGFANGTANGKPCVHENLFS